MPSTTKPMLLFCILALLQFYSVAMASPKFFNLTAISAVDGKSTLECWQLTTPIVVSTQPGTNGVAIQQLGDVSNASYVSIPPKYDGGLHQAPTVQSVMPPLYPTCHA